jgi:hypothetical protein
MAYVRFWIFSEDLSRKIFLSMMSSGLLILTIMASAEAWAQTSRLKDTACGVNPSRTLFRNLKREEVALFFQNHVSKDQLRLAEFLSKYKTKASRAAAIKMALEMNFVNQRALDEITTAIGDLYIQKKIDWMGVEVEASELGAEDESSLFKQASAIETQLKKDRMKAGDIRAFLLLQIGPVLYSRWRNDALRRSARLVALDDISIRMRVSAYRDKLEERARILLKSVSHSGLRTSEMERIIEICQIDLFAGQKDRSTEFRSLTAKLKSLEARKVVEEYRTWIEQGVESFREQELHVANQIMAQSGNGMIHISRSLGPGVTDHLVNSCIKSPANKKSNQKSAMTSLLRRG